MSATSPRLPVASLLFCGALLGTSAASVCAQGYPTRTIRMIVPFAPGGNTDIIARIYAPTTQEQGLKSFVVSSGFAMFAPTGAPKPAI
ncbi:MAG TPA: hypothetical protein VFG44_08580, partial [Burkholderiales bacterium]|nr:hypothetical protein [Burkholderiales bacterium]